jgi:translation initiation factor 4E
MATETAAETPFEIKDEQRPLNEIPVSPPNGEQEENAATTEQPQRQSHGRPGDDQQLTVFHDAENFNVKHPLMNKWTLWFTKPPSGKVCRSG